MTEDEIEVEYRPTKKIVILNLEELEKEELFARASAIRMTEHPIFLNWAEGVVFLSRPASPDISEVDENITQGVSYFASIIFALMPKYQPMVQVGVDKVPVINQCKSTVYRAIGKWILRRCMNRSA